MPTNVPDIMPASIPTCGMSEPSQNASFFTQPIHDTYLPLNQQSYGLTSQTPCLKILEQPKNKVRFRYTSEKGSHGVLTGENAASRKNCFPTVKLENYCGKRPVFISAGLYTNEDFPQPHVHYFTGSDDTFNVKLGDDMTAVFKKLNIGYCKASTVPKILYERSKAQFSQFVTKEEEKRIMSECKDAAKLINLNSVKICFEAYTFNESTGNKEFVCAPVFSNPIMHQNAVACADLKITRISKVSGLVTGDEEVFLLCEKVDKKNIKVKFEELNCDGIAVWEEYGKFCAADVHHQYAIVFKTPKYYRTDIDQKVRVFLYLYRPSDNGCSEKIDFHYIPVSDYDIETTSKKRKKVDNFGDSLSSPQSDCMFMSSELNRSFSNTSSVSQSSGTSNCSGSQSSLSTNNEVVSPPHVDEDSVNSPVLAQITPDFLSYFLSDTSSDIDSLYNQMLISEGSTFETDSIAYQDHDAVGNLVNEVTEKFNSLSLSFQESVLRYVQNYESSSSIKGIDALSQRANGQAMTLIERVCRFIANIHDENGNNILHLLLQQQDIHQFTNCCWFLQSLMEQLVNSKNKFGRTPLHYAVLGNCTDISKLLLSFSNPNISNAEGDTPLHLAVKQKLCANVRLLLTSKSRIPLDVDAVNHDGLTPLHCAILNKNEECVKLLCAARANVNKRDGKSGRTALHLACENFPQILKYFVEETCVDIDAKDYAGKTVFDLAIINEYPEAIQVLIKAGAGAPIQNNDSASFATKDAVPSHCEPKDPNALALLCDKADDRKREDITPDKHSSENTEDIDSGFISGESLSFLDDSTLRKLSNLLDPPKEGWKQLAFYLGVDDCHINPISKLDNSPSCSIIKKFQENGGEVNSLMMALEFANLTEAHAVVKQFVENL